MKNIKNLFSAIAVIIAISITSVVSAKTVETVKNYNDFKITRVEAENTAADGVWNLNYSDSDTGIKIYLVENKGAKEYLVRGEFIDVRYVFGKKGFGARHAKISNSNVPVEILSQVINEDALKMQKIITPNTPDNDTALALIASYLPQLINDNYKHILN